MKNQSLRGTSKLRLPEKWLGRRQLRCHTTGNPSTHNLLLVVVFALYAVGAQAQATPKYDFSLGYSYIPLHVPNTSGRVNMNGIEVDITRKLNRFFGFTGEFTEHYHCVAVCQSYTSSARNRAFGVLAGPRLSLPLTPATSVSVRTLFGMSNVRYSDDLGRSLSSTGVAIGDGR